MQIENWEREALAFLSDMATGAGNPWNKGKAQVYLLVLRNLGEEAARRAVEYAVMNCKWRPEPAELREIAANLYSPLPPVGDLWREFWHKAITLGYDKPRWSHPVVKDIARALGGWPYLRSVCWWDSDVRFRENLQRRFEATYAQRTETWWKQVADQLRLPAAERDPHYFPDYSRFNPPALLPPDEGNDEPVLTNKEVKRILSEAGYERIGNGASNGKERSDG
jgi:hypothetical protein